MMTMATEPKPILIGFHHGNVISYLSNLYGNPLVVLREAVQNAIDENATKICIWIDCIHRYIIVYDNGDGAMPEDITKKFQMIGLSLKEGMVGKIGKKGIGNVAGLAIAKRWEFVTRKLNAGYFRRYTFNASELNKAQGLNVEQEVLDIKRIGSSEPAQSATTMVKLHEVSEVALRQLKDQKSIEQILQEAFNSVLRLKKIDLSVYYKDLKGKSNTFSVKPVLFRGSKMDPVVYETEYGKIEFRLFYSALPIIRPNILVQHQGVMSLPMVNFLKLKLLPESVGGLFDKGYFEGEICLGFCTVDAARVAFVYDEAMKVFVDKVNQFVEDALSPLIIQLENADRKERLKKIGDGVVKKWRDFCKNNPDRVPESFRTLIEKPATKAGEANPSIKTDPVKFPQKRKTLPPDILVNKKKEGEERRRQPSVKPSPKNKREEFQAVDGLGIHFVYPDPEEGLRWHSRINNGVLEINIAHSNFIEADKRGQIFLVRYLTSLLQVEMTTALLGGHAGEVYHEGSELMMQNFFSLSLRD